MALLVVLTIGFVPAEAQTSSADQQMNALQTKVELLERQLEEVKGELTALRETRAAVASSPANVPAPAPSSASETRPAVSTVSAEKTPPQLSLPAGATVNATIDGYYGYNFNHPAGRVNSLRAYDVLSNSFNLNQAAVLFELPTDPDLSWQVSPKLLLVGRRTI